MVYHTSLIICYLFLDLRVDLILFDFNFFKHGGHVSQRIDFQWAVQININQEKAYITKKPYIQHNLTNKLSEITSLLILYQYDQKRQVKRQENNREAATFKLNLTSESTNL